MTKKLAYTYEEAAAECGLSISALKQAVSRGSLVLRYADAESVIRHEDLVEWVAQLPIKPNTGLRTAEADPKSSNPRSVKTNPTSPPEHASDFLTPEDLGKMLQVSVGTLSNWRSGKKGPAFFRIGGGLVRYRCEAVEVWLKAQSSE